MSFKDLSQMLNNNRSSLFPDIFFYTSHFVRTCCYWKFCPGVFLEHRSANVFYTFMAGNKSHTIWNLWFSQLSQFEISYFTFVSIA